MPPRPRRTPPRSLLAVATNALLCCLIQVASLSGCTFSADYDDTSFLCVEAPHCPRGFRCIEGRCVTQSQLPSHSFGGGHDAQDDSTQGQMSSPPQHEQGSDAGADPDAMANEPPPPPEEPDRDGAVPDDVDGGAQPPVQCDGGPTVAADCPDDPCPGAQQDGDGDGECDEPAAAGPPVWVSAPNYPLSLGAMGAATLDGQVHVMGGDTSWTGSTPSRAHNVYEAPSQRFLPRAATPDGSQWGPCVRAHDGYIYSFGGWQQGGRSMRRYDPTADSWTYLASSPAVHLYGFACALVDGELYVIGGSTASDGTTTAAVSAYNIATDTWHSRTPLPRSARGLAGDAVGNSIYVVGRGNALDIYDTTTDRWSSGPPMDREVRFAAAVSHAGSFYVFGGDDSDDVDRLQLPAMVWSALPAMSAPREEMAVAVVGNQIHLFGGFIEGGATPVSIHEYLMIPAP